MFLVNAPSTLGAHKHFPMLTAVSDMMTRELKAEDWRNDVSYHVPGMGNRM